LLICGENAAGWRVAGESIAQEFAVPMTALQVGHTSGDWFDVRCAWLKQREVEPTGCVLVRPDRFVAWRTIDGRGDAEPQLRAVLAQLGLASGGGAKARG
jgi:2,4-dichlorophenol 6-monooxygenase